MKAQDFKSNWVAFSAARAQSVCLVLSSCALDEYNVDYVADYGYLVNDSPAEEREVDRDIKIFYAERYGGYGIMRNGGGTRSGQSGRYQVKGIGLTPLAGPFVDERYATGGMSLFVGLREMFGSVLLSAALPYGCVSCVALMQTGHTFKVKAGESDTARALMVREETIRIASFERAIYFKPIKNFAESNITDRQRVVNNFAQLLSSCPEGNSSSLDLTNQALSEVNKWVGSVATQMAYARLQHIRHGALTSSNIDIAGRWLDLETFRYLINPIGSLEVKEFFAEYRRVERSFADVVFYIYKYVLGEVAGVSVAASRVVALYRKLFDERLVEASLVKLGFSKRYVDSVGVTAEARNLANFVQEISGQDLRRPNATFSCTAPIKHLPVIAYLLATHEGERLPCRQAVANAYQACEGAKQLCHQLYSDYVRQLQAVVGAAVASHIVKAAALVSARTCAPFLSLEEGFLDAEIDSVLTVGRLNEEGVSSVRQKFSEWHSSVSNRFELPASEVVLCWAYADGGTLSFDIETGMYRIKVKNDMRDIVCSQLELLIPHYLAVSAMPATLRELLGQRLPQKAP